MPLAIPGRTKDAVVIAAGDDWLAGVEAFLRSLGGDDARVARHGQLLEDRAAGRRPWLTELAGRTLPSGRPMPPSRAYADMLVSESSLPLYDVGGFEVSIDLHNPLNEADVDWFDAGSTEIAIVADQGAFTGAAFEAAGDPETAYRRRAERGARLGALVASLAEHVKADFAYVDVGSSGGVVTAAARPGSVVHPVTGPARPHDFLWSITIWGPRYLDAAFEARLDVLSLDPAHLQKIDHYARPHVRLEQQRLACGGRLLQFRYLFGSESRGERAHIDTPLAEQLGRRSTNLQYRA